MSALALCLVGCGPTAQSYCSQVCDCVGCSEEEEDDCIDDYEDAEKFAEDEGCGDQADDYASCIDSEFECRNGNVDADGCISELQALGRCLN